jgi:hypothetical protein
MVLILTLLVGRPAAARLIATVANFLLLRPPPLLVRCLAREEADQGNQPGR